MKLVRFVYYVPISYHIIFLLATISHGRFRILLPSVYLVRPFRRAFNLFLFCCFLSVPCTKATPWQQQF